MLFHVTIIHRAVDCPGSRLHALPPLVTEGPGSDRPRLVLWGAACLLFAKREHIAYALVDADSVEAALEQVRRQVPDGWQCRAMPVWVLPDQLPLVRQVLAGTKSAAMAGLQGEQGVPATPVMEPPTQPTEPFPAAETVVVGRPSGSGADEDETQVQAQRSRIEEPALGDLPTKVLPSVPTVKPTQPILRLMAEDGSMEYRVGEDGATIGRAPSSDIRLSDERVSARHARIEWRDGAYWLVDLQSTNGTAINDTLVIQSARLEEGDVIAIGRSRLAARLHSGSE